MRELRRHGVRPKAVMTHTPKQTDVQGRGVVLRLEPGTVAHDWDTGVKGSCLPGPRTCVASVFAKLGGRAGGQLVSEALIAEFIPRRASLSSTISGARLR